MFKTARRKAALLSALVLVMIAVTAGIGYAAPGTKNGRGHADPSCTASSNPATVGQTFTLSAVGLPTTDPVYLIVQPPSGDATVSEVLPSSDGDWSGSELAKQSGSWTYSFSGLMTNNKYGIVASCTVRAS